MSVLLTVNNALTTETQLNAIQTATEDISFSAFKTTVHCDCLFICTSEILLLTYLLT